MKRRVCRRGERERPRALPPSTNITSFGRKETKTLRLR
jgi:hypothetical protein